MNSLVIAHLEAELAVEVSLGDIELNTEHIGALILGESVNVQSTLARVVVAQVLQNIGLNLTHIEHDNFSAISNLALVEGKRLAGGIVGCLLYTSDAADD